LVPLVPGLSAFLWSLRAILADPNFLLPSCMSNHIKHFL
jgi:hypothetical protein